MEPLRLVEQVRLGTSKSSGVSNTREPLRLVGASDTWESLRLGSH